MSASSTSSPTVLIVPGLRDHVDAHWQTLLAAQLPQARTVPPMGRTGAGLDRAARVQAIEQAAQAIEGPIVIVAHSGGCPMVAHWAAQTRRAVHGALLATPPELDQPMPEGYPPLEALQGGGWFPVPLRALPFPHYFLQPLDGPDRDAAIAACVAYCRDHPPWRVSLQTHKLLRIP